jgi:hypothetical protein
VGTENQKSVRFLVLIEHGGSSGGYLDEAELVEKLADFSEGHLVSHDEIILRLA